jgi:hypothetical protein
MVAGPGTGKSTTAAGTFFELKTAGVNCELVTEFAKDLVWEGRVNTLDNQVYLLGKQYHRLWRLQDKVEVIITDSPIFLLTYYGGKMSENFHNLTLELFNSMDNMTFFLNRVKVFNPAGRVQTEEKAREIDAELLNLLSIHTIPYLTLDADEFAPKHIAGMVLGKLNV